METADFRGLACPLPVVRCRDLLRAGAKDLRLLVDNEPAVDNVSRFLRGQGFAVSVAQEGPACWSLTASADEAAGQPPAGSPPRCLCGKKRPAYPGAYHHAHPGQG